MVDYWGKKNFHFSLMLLVFVCFVLSAEAQLPRRMGHARQWVVDQQHPDLEQRLPV